MALSITVLSDILNVIMLSVAFFIVMLSVIMLTFVLKHKMNKREM